MRATNVLLLLSVLFTSAYTFELQSYIKLYQSTGGALVSFLSGLTKGLVGEDLGSDLGQCLFEGEGIAAEIQDAIGMIETNEWAGIINGVFELIQVAKEVPMAFADCGQISSSAISKLYVFAERFADYNALLNRVTLNLFYYGVEIYGDLNKAKDAYYAAQYYESGVYAGEAVELATR